MKIKQKLPENKYEFGAFLLRNWLKVIAILFSSGLIMFLLQIKTIKVGDYKIEKQAFKTQFKK